MGVVSLEGWGIVSNTGVRPSLGVNLGRGLLKYGSFKKGNIKFY